MTRRIPATTPVGKTIDERLQQLDKNLAWLIREMATATGRKEEDMRVTVNRWRQKGGPEKSLDQQSLIGVLGSMDFPKPVRRPLGPDAQGEIVELVTEVMEKIGSPPSGAAVPATIHGRLDALEASVLGLKQTVHELLPLVRQALGLPAEGLAPRQESTGGP